MAKKLIDAILLTKNSERMLRRCLDSLYSNVPVNRLIVVDAYSSDHTLSILKDYSNVVIVFDDGTRATARQKGIEAVETEWFMFIDSDIVLDNNWLNKEVLESMGNPEVGAVQGFDYPVWGRQEVYDIREAMEVLRGRLRLKEKSIMLDRGFTGDTLIRSKVVKDIKIPSYLHVYEDAYIKRWIEKKGYRWVVSETSTCKHYVNYYQKLDRITTHIIGYKTGFLNFKNVLRAILTAIPKGIFASIIKRKPNLLFFLLSEQIHTLVGFLKGWIAYG